MMTLETDSPPPGFGSPEAGPDDGIVPAVARSSSSAGLNTTTTTTTGFPASPVVELAIAVKNTDTLTTMVEDILTTYVSPRVVAQEDAAVKKKELAMTPTRSETMENVSQTTPVVSIMRKSSGDYLTPREEEDSDEPTIPAPGIPAPAA